MANIDLVICKWIGFVMFDSYESFETVNQSKVGSIGRYHEDLTPNNQQLSLIIFIARMHLWILIFYL